VKKTEKIIDRLISSEGVQLKSKVSAEIQKHLNSGLTLDKNMFKAKVSTLDDECFKKINDLTILTSCQRTTITNKRLPKLIKIARDFCPIKFGRVQLAKIKGDPNFYIYDSLGRTVVAYCLGIEWVPCEIVHFSSQSEVLKYFFEQHDNEEKLSRWTRIEAIYNAPKSMQLGYFKRENNKVIDIFHVLGKTGCVYDSLKATDKNPSVESACTRFKDCITKEWSGNGSASAGSRPCYALIQSIEMIKRLWISHEQKEILANFLAAIVYYATDGGFITVTKRDLLNKKNNKSVKEINNRLYKLEKKIRRIDPNNQLVTQKELWGPLLLCSDLSNSGAAIEGGSKIKLFVQKNFDKSYLKVVKKSRNHKKK
jgi:hypothetical protein